MSTAAVLSDFFTAALREALPALQAAFPRSTN